MRPIRMAHPALPADRWQRDAVLVLGAIAFFLAIAAVAVLLNPAPLR